MFSVIIPLYNKETTIYNTLRSVLHQSFMDFEIIVINDGSTDNSVEVVQALTDSRIRLLNQENKGVSAARNAGIKAAKNDWVSFLDGDDLWQENHLQEYHNIIMKSPHLNWLISGYTIRSHKKIWNKTYTKSGKLQNVIEDLHHGLSIHTSTVCIKKKLFDLFPDLHFRVGMNNSEDREVWYKLCCIDKSPFYINESLAIYDVTSNSSLTKQISRNEHFLTMKERISSFEPFRQLDRKDIDKLLLFIRKFNCKAICFRYVEGHFEEKYIEHLSKRQFLIYNSSSRLPRTFRKIISRLC